MNLRSILQPKNIPRIPYKQDYATVYRFHMTNALGHGWAVLSHSVVSDSL